MVSLVKKLLDITSDEFDEKISFFCEYTTRFVLDYCNLDILPDELTNSVAFIASSLYNSSPTKISMGDMSLEFNDNIKLYKNILNKYRRV